MARGITTGEYLLIKDVFKDTLRYPAIRCDQNKANIGGKENSLTPAGVIYFSTKQYCEDFSQTLDGFQRWLFVHEMMHVWQWGHDVYPVWQALGLLIAHGGDYDAAYPYDLTPGKSLTDYNIEQQASIVADYWALLTKQHKVRDNRNTLATIAEYLPLIAELQAAGPSLPKLDQVPRGI
jgi:hypothetical protein